MTPRLLATCILAVIVLPVWAVLNVAADLLGGDEGNVPEWVKE